MITISLQIDDVLQGNYHLGELNLILFFQPTCAGCFTYAIPETLKLEKEHASWLTVFGMSTMFENPELNSTENTRKILWTGELNGEAKTAFQEMGLDQYPHEITFPILRDLIVTPSDHVEKEMERLCSMYPDFAKWNEPEQEALRTKIRAYAKAYPKAGFSFVFNMLPGTPTWILVTEDMQLLGTWFGYDSIADLKSTLLEIQQEYQKDKSE